MMENIGDTLKSLKTAYKKTKRPIWLDMYRRIKRSTRSEKAVVNLSKLDKIAPDGAYVIIPGMVLGNGSMAKKITVGALKYSKAAKYKINKAGGEALSVEEFASSYKEKEGILIVK